MQPSDNLSRLIHAMTKGEKRVFHQQYKLQTGKKAYAKLYNLIVKRKCLCDSKAIKLVGMEGRHQAFYNLKNFLQNHILNSLTITYNGSESEIERKTIWVKILIRKRIFSLAKKIIIPALEQARREERFLYALELSRLFLIIQKEMGDLSESQGIKGYRQDIFVQFQDTFLYESNFEQFSAELRSFRTYFSVESTLWMESLRKKPLFQRSELAITARSKRCFWGFQYLLAMQEGRFQDALMVSRKLLGLYSEHSFLIADHFEEYVSMGVNSGRLMLTLGKVQECKDLLEEGFFASKASESGYLGDQMGILRLYYAIASGDQEAGKETVQNFEQNYVQQTNDCNNMDQLATIYAIAYFHIAFGDPEKALSWASRLNQRFLYQRDKDGGYPRSDLRWATRILNLVIAFELEDGYLLEKNHRTAYRYLYVRDLLKGYKGQFVSAVNLAVYRPLLERKVYYREEIEKLEATLGNPQERRFLIYFDGLVWLKGKLERKTIAEMNRETINEIKNEAAF